MIRHPYTLAALAAILTAGAVAGAVYYAHYAWKHGPHALTPLEAWLVTRSQRGALNRELAAMAAEA